MMLISKSHLLQVWHRAADQVPARRSLALLSGLTDAADGAGELPAGERDRRLLLIRSQLFGDRIDAVTQCPSCEARMEFACSTVELTDAAPASPPQNPLLCDDYEVQWRLPTSADLAELAVVTEAPQIKQQLVERCVLEIRHQQQSVDTSECPSELIDHVCQAMAAADPFADLQFELQCPECGGQWQAAFDVGAFLWSELDAWARQLLWEIHCLASRYGWSEAEILALPSERRKLYLELLES